MTGATGPRALDLGAPLPHSGEVDDPYPFLAAARRKGSVQIESPFGTTSDAGRAFHVLGYDEVVAVLRDSETFSSRLLSDLMGPCSPTRSSRWTSLNTVSIARSWRRHFGPRCLPTGKDR